MTTMLLAGQIVVKPERRALANCRHHATHLALPELNLRLHKRRRRPFVALRFIERIRLLSLADYTTRPGDKRHQTDLHHAHITIVGSSKDGRAPERRDDLVEGFKLAGKHSHEILEKHMPVQRLREFEPVWPLPT